MKKADNLIRDNWEAIDDSMVRTQKKLLLHPKFSYFELLSVDIVKTAEILNALSTCIKIHVSGVEDTNKEMILFLEKANLVSQEDMDELAKLMLVHYFIPRKKWNSSLINEWIRNSESDNSAVAYSLHVGESLLVCLIPLSTIIGSMERSIA